MGCITVLSYLGLWKRVSEGAERWNLLLQWPHPLSPRAAREDQKVKAEASVQIILTLAFREWKKSVLEQFPSHLNRLAMAKLEIKPIFPSKSQCSSSGTTPCTLLYGLFSADGILEIRHSKNKRSSAKYLLPVCSEMFQQCKTDLELTHLASYHYLLSKDSSGNTKTVFLEPTPLFSPIDHSP